MYDKNHYNIVKLLQLFYLHFEIFLFISGNLKILLFLLLSNEVKGNKLQIYLWSNTTEANLTDYAY